MERNTFDYHERLFINIKTEIQAFFLPADFFQPFLPSRP